MEAVAGSKCNDQMLIVMGAVVKLFVGDLVETGVLQCISCMSGSLRSALHLWLTGTSAVTCAARQIGHELNEISPDGRLQPSHYRMAFQQLESQGKILQARSRKRMRL